MDSSSAFQDSLPMSSDELLAMLEEGGFTVQRIDHIPLRTVADSKQVRGGFLSTEQGGGHIKNLYLRDRKKQNYLVVLLEDADIDLKILSEQIGAARLSFGSADRLLENLGVRPGAVTPLAMVTGVQHDVKLFMDSRLKDMSCIYMHPLVNDRTVGMAPGDVDRFLRSTGCQINWLDISS